MRRKIIFLVLLGTILMMTAPAVYADKVYHSERLDFELTEAGIERHPILQYGHVVNIHPNGPVIGALERYMIIGAMPSTRYDVNLKAFAEGDCGGLPLLNTITTTMVTDGKGNAHDEVFFSAEDLVAYSGARVDVQWTLVADGVNAYQTKCTLVEID